MPSPDQPSLFEETGQFRLPERLAVFGRVEGNLVKRLEAPEQFAAVTCSPLSSGRGFRCVTADGFTFAVVDYNTTSTHGCAAALKVISASSVADISTSLNAGRGKWILPRPQKPSGYQTADVAQQIEDAQASWLDGFELRAERYEGDRLIRPGLRVPQVGAINAIKAHWSVSTKPATVVLPTGTGKTDTMLALLVSERIGRLLVVVPTDPLRTQLAAKFISLGVLKENGCCSAGALYPNVAVLKSGISTIEALDRFLGSAQVIVSTMSILARMDPALQAHIAATISHLFVDEAHHIGARTWRSFKLQFSHKPVLQFTATPFRTDGRRVDGKFIYIYPLRRAQEQKLFKPIKYVPVFGLNEDDTDQKIIRRVGEQLETDTQNGFNHLAMARTRTVDRAVLLHAAYQRQFPQHSPQLIHSEMPHTKRAEALNELRNGRSRIIVCVDMLGEGFDLPDLKIAGLHDKHKSEAITLQFVGRFTRSRQDLGDATVIANISIDDVNERLKALYAEDADWNHILSVTGAARTDHERRREDVFGGFEEMPEEFPLETFEPRLSAVAYRTTCTEWQPEAVVEAIRGGSSIVEGPFINREERLVVFVTRDEDRLRWTSIKATKNIEYNMVMLHWDAEQSLLFINSSRLQDLHADLAKKVCGDDAERVAGEDVFRVLHGFRRLVLTNLGLSETQRKPVRYSMFMGSDIGDQLDTLPGNRSRTKTNLFGLGFIDLEDFDDGEVIGTWPAKATIGCSTKGKIWSYQTTNSFAEWIEWCQRQGRKLLNPAITSETILRNVIRPKRVQALPEGKTPIAIAWPERFLYDSEERIDIVIGEAAFPFFNCEIELTEFELQDAIRFTIRGDGASAVFALKITEGVVSYVKISGDDVKLRKRRNDRPILEVLKEDPPHVYFADGSLLIGAELFALERDEAFTPYDTGKISAGDWAGVDIRKESQGQQKYADSIQRRVIEQLLSDMPPYDIIFDDDGSGEAADVITLRRNGRTLQVGLYHCKYSSESAPGGRVGDLYEVCGQAQKSVRWAERLDEFLHHLRRREADGQLRGRVSRFERGDISGLLGLISQWRELHAEFAVTIVQPGYSKAAAARAHLELFAATEAFLMDTWRIPLRVWAST